MVDEDGSAAGLPDAFGDRLARLVLDIGDDDRGSLLGEPDRDRVSDAAGGSGDECLPPVQPLHDDLLDVSMHWKGPTVLWSRCADQRIDRVVDYTVDFNRPQNPLRSLDGQSGKLRRNDLRRVQDARLLRAAYALAEIGQVMADDQDLAACRQSRAGIPQHSRPLISRDLEVRDERELVGVGGWLVVEQVSQHPIDGNVALRRELPSLVQAHGRSPPQ